jgi:hypothetical protein
LRRAAAIAPSVPALVDAKVGKHATSQARNAEGGKAVVTD